MKIKLIIIGILIHFSINLYAQDAKEILKNSILKCQTIQNGYYEISINMKYSTENDTTFSQYFCSFKKLKEDTIYYKKFHYKQYYKGEYSGEILYTGEDFVATNAQDSTGDIISKVLWTKDLVNFRHNYTFYTPFTDYNSKPLPQDSDFTDNLHIFKFIGLEKIDDIQCYHIEVQRIPQVDTNSMFIPLKVVNNFWISTKDFIPLQYTSNFDAVMSNDTMHQYEKVRLNKFQINNLQDTTVLTLSSIPSFYKIKKYEPYKAPELLPNNSKAPDWKLQSTKGEMVSLSDLKGKIVLLDFFYKSCYPCMQALPALQKLSEKYKNDDLRVIGIDPYDEDNHEINVGINNLNQNNKSDDYGISSFLQKRGVTYTVLLHAKETAKEYNVSGYPTMYLIDKDGTIIYSNIGYGPGLEDEIEQIILKHLNGPTNIKQ